MSEKISAQGGSASGGKNYYYSNWGRGNFAGRTYFYLF